MLRFSARISWKLVRRTIRGHQMPFVLGLLLLALSALTSCSIGSALGTGEYTIGASSLLQDARTAINTDSAFHFTMKIDHPGTTGASTPAIDAATGDAKKPNQVKGTATVSMGGSGAAVQFISIGSQQWILSPLSPQWVSAGQAGINLSGVFDPNTGIGAMLNALQKTGANNGEDAVSGDGACWIVEGNLSPSAVASIVGVTPSGTVPVDTTVCVAKNLDAKGLRQPYLLIFKGIVTAGDTSQTTRTLTLSHFNEDITIQPPQQ